MYRATYVRFFIWSSIMLSILIIPFSLFFADRFSHYAYEQAGEFNQEKIGQTVERTQYMLMKLKLYSLNIYEDQSIQNWMYAQTDDELVDAEALRVLTKYLANEPFIDRAYLINTRLEKGISSTIGLARFPEFPDNEILLYLDANRPEFLRYFDHRTGDDSYLALIVPSTPARKEYYGYLVVLLDKKKLQKLFLTDHAETGNGLMILDDSGSLILGDSSGLDLEKLNNTRKSTDSGSYELVDNGVKWFVNYTAMPPQNWMMYSFTDLKNFQRKAQSFQWAIVMCSLLLLAVLFLAAFWHSKRFFGPLRRLADQLQRKVGLQAKNEYGVIEQGVELLRNHFSLIKAEYLRQWILQGRLYQSTREAISRESELLAFDLIRLVVIKIDSYSTFSEKYDFSSRRLMKYAMGNIAEELLREPGRVIEFVDFGGDHIVVLVGEANPDGDLIGALQTVRREVEKSTGLNITIAASDARHVHDDLRKVYDEISDLTMFKFISGDDKIYTSQDYESYLQTQRTLLDDTLTEHLIQSVRSGNEERMLSMLEELFLQLQTMKYSECKFQLNLLFFTIVKSFNKLTSIQSVESIENHLKHFSTLSEVSDWLKEELLRIINLLTSRKGFSRKDKVVEEMVEYVHYHIHDPMLSVDEIAEHVSLSKKYVRQLFDEVRGVSISNYILNTRIDKVKELLRNTDLPITDIFEQSGFQTKSHFFTAFKKAMGMTPNQYRLSSNEANA
ncbi:helix-turn-helix domain-containing protein [Paenibacillus lutimineralis]|uniref:AraC family transcriptional regulator n=1 Tax=Paenibacillus lutimineralis TaxID=2707005 RepID=A0A3Q9I6I6_9BACL|nr:helix-turn-helix domain-containing protein [Paenibacillus lutimineralis]AZS13793.1 AraC family transcriptional regulator [Paenibacillus lutimineralis]